MLAVVLAGCEVETFDDAVSRIEGGAAPPPPPPPGGLAPNFSEIQAAVFTPTCATSTCHSGGSPAAGLNLDANNSYSMLVGVASSQDASVLRVNPGNPSASYLVQKLEGTASGGGPMPPSGSLEQATIDTIRQWISDGAIDDRVPAAGPIKVSSLSPAPQATLSAPPASVIAGFDRDLDATTVNLNTYMLTASVDGVFGNGDDMQVTAAQISVPAGNPRSAVFELSGVAMPDDLYQVTLSGSAPSMIMDLDGNALDGEFSGGFPSGNGVAGGDFVTQFTISTPAVIGPTLPQIQAVVFGPTCAVGGCHTGGGAVLPGVMDLSNEQASYDNLVNVPALEIGGGGAFRVLPNDPDMSYLVQKLEGDQMVGNQMPPSGALDQSIIDEIRQWIADGAPRN